jgi:hypothetical protein
MGKRELDTSEHRNGETVTRRASLTAATPARERRPGLRAVGSSVTRLAAPIITRQGGGILARLKAEWPAVVGAEWAERAWPAALGRDGALRLRVATAAALELQHRAPLVLERINLYFGRAVATRLVLVQGPLPLPPRAGRTPPRPLAPAEAASLETRLAPIADPALRDALNRLGRAVIADDDGDGDASLRARS